MTLRPGPCLSLVLLLGSCVPSDPPAGTQTSSDLVLTPPLPVQRWRPHAVMPAPSATPLGRAGSPEEVDADPKLTAVFRDDFDRPDLGEHWNATSPGWSIIGGQLCGQSNRNHPVWLKRRIPTNARITFVARAKSDQGDLKAEAWGHGRTFAKGTSYDDATSYVFVLGGWKNQLHVLARLNEHDPSRLQLRLDPASQDRRLAPVVANVPYAFAIERRDGKTVRWSVDATELFVLEDPAPLSGRQHDHFAFNNWESPVCFDDLTITPLPE